MVELAAGMMWLAGQEQSFEEELKSATAYYHRKYKKTATACYVNIADTEGREVNDEEEFYCGSIKITVTNYMPPHHFLII